ncbi:MAG TPA: tetratricopeptide repeat protein [Usitatibacter sp.]|nr:tetratricopeptide repeat protein [Usitatibacter sp.]
MAESTSAPTHQPRGVHIAIPQSTQASASDSAHRLYMQAQAQVDRRKIGEAEALCRAALQLDRNHVRACNLLGMIVQAKGDARAAIPLYRKALSLQQHFPDALCNLGGALEEAGRPAEALVCLRRAIAQRPDFAEAWANLGSVLLKQEEPGRALDCYRRALALKPGMAEVHVGIAGALGAQGKVREAIASTRQAIALFPQAAAWHSALLAHLMLHAEVTPGECARSHFEFASRFEQPLRAAWRPHGNDRDPERRLKVGFVSGDLWDHPVTRFIEPVWQALPRSSIDLHVYSNGRVRDAATDRLRSLAGRWHDVQALTDERVVELVRSDGIDILVDLSGHTAYNRLLAFARKPAPVQATWIGYPGTTGLESIDYLICDPFNAPHGLYERYYREKFARLPSAVAFEPPREAPEVNPLPALRTGILTFGSFNRPAKLREPVIEAWSRVLHALPQSRMLIGHAGDPGLCASLQRQFAACGIAVERLAFRPRMAFPEYLAAHHEVDIMLDTWPYTGGTTSNHALWMGVPLVTLRGPSRAHCQGAAAMARLGLEDWIAGDVDEFVELAVARAQDLHALARLREGMRRRWLESPWLDRGIVARGLEAALRLMWRRWCDGLPPADLDVALDGVRHGHA